ncbi:MAG: copper chaperone PCu(A)C [Pseudomonadota bacterium]
MLSLFLSTAALAKSEVTVQDPWSRATARTATTGAIYFTLVNHGGEQDRLIAADSPVAEVVELHTHIEEDGILKMRPVDGVDVPAAGRVSFQPGGLHVMLVGLKAALKEGRTVPVTLTFEKMGTVTVEARILPVGARAPN